MFNNKATLGAPHGQTQSKMVRHPGGGKTKLSSVTLDVSDDGGHTLKEMFPDADTLPDAIKHAEFKPLDQMDEEDYSLVAVEAGSVLHKYASNDQGTTMVSSIYFLEHGHKLPDDLRKTAATNLVDACYRHDVKPPEELLKQANADLAPVGASNVAEAPSYSLIKQAEHYAIEFDDGTSKYPIDTWDQVKLAEDYYFEYHNEIDPHTRRHYAVKLAARSEDIGYPLHDRIKEAGATSYAHHGHIKQALESRKVAIEPSQRGMLDSLFEKTASMHPDEYAESLRQFDVHTGLDNGWGSVILDPWASTFGMDKTAEVLWEDGSESVTKERIESLARNFLPSVSKHFTPSISSEFSKDPVSVFNSMPAPQKVLFARLANDSVI